MTAIWDSRGRRGSQIRVQYIEHFTARGMCCMYRRCDQFGRGRTFHLDVWLTRTGRLLARFWARREEVDWYAFEILGMGQTPLPRHRNSDLDEYWVPQCLRKEYDDWILSEF